MGGKATLKDSKFHGRFNWDKSGDLDVDWLDSMRITDRFSCINVRLGAESDFSASSRDPLVT